MQTEQTFIVFGWSLTHNGGVAGIIAASQLQDLRFEPKLKLQSV